MAARHACYLTWLNKTHRVINNREAYFLFNDILPCVQIFGKMVSLIHKQSVYAQPYLRPQIGRHCA